MGVRWQPIAWPITGGIDTRKAPVAVAPGSFIKLQNVRQERDGEWRTRAGTTHNALDDVGAGLTREVGLPGGARVGMTRESGFSPAVRAYSSGSTVARWATPIAGDCSQSSPSLWARRTIVATDSVAAS